MERLSVGLMLIGIVMLAGSSFLFLFMNHWIVAEAVVWVLGFFLIIGASKLSPSRKKKS